MFQQLIILQIIAYLLSSYFYQSEAQVKCNIENGFKSKFIFKHALITFVISWITSFNLNFVVCAFAIAIIHFTIDGFQKQFKRTECTYTLVQLFKLTVIFLSVYLYTRYFDSSLFFLPVKANYYLLICLGYLICFKPTNILIRQVIIIAKIKITSDPTVELENAGKLIGILERILVLTFVIIGKLEVIGFLIAAKSLLRYKDTDTIKTEYVLIGTMLSFGIAMLLGLLINNS